jgi:Raf kinase inhibitor-like YbhB/YbcL family protein
MGFRIWTPAFGDGETIPSEFTCDGEDRRPTLRWEDAPEGTQSFALICDDPDAPSGTWVHWTIFNIPGPVGSLADSAEAELPQGAIEGRNSWGRVGYGGPCPPPGKPHRYFFKLYALDVALALDSHADRQRLLAAMEGHVLAEAQVMGTYGR